MHYVGAVPAAGLVQVAMLQEVRESEPPVRLAAAFFEPGTAAQLAAELRGLGDTVVAVAAPITPRGDGGRRSCDLLLERRGLRAEPFHPETAALAQALWDLGVFAPAGDAPEGQVPEGAFREAPLFETSAEAVFCALQRRRLPARRHPLGVRLRIEELAANQVLDDGGDLWHRRIEELDAAAAALCAHRYAVAHASWLGRGDEGVLVLPGPVPPARFPTEGVLPPVERLQLPPTP